MIAALVEARFDEIVDEDVATARLLGLAPYGASADVSGEGALDFVATLRDDPSVTVEESAAGFIVRAADVDTLARALHDAPRPSEKFRVAVQ